MAQTTRKKARRRSSAERAAIILGDAPINKRGSKPSALTPWLKRATAIGMTNEQAIWHLHVVEGLPFVEIARQLGLGLNTVRSHYELIVAEIAANAPKTEGDYTSMRQELGARIMAVHNDATGGMGDPKRHNPKMLAVRLTALRQYAQLYGLNLEQEQQDKGATPYVTPEEIALDVQRKALALYGRVADVQEARLALERDVTPPKKESEA